MNAVSGTGFDREASLNAWRSALLTRGGLTSADVDELQDHLEVTEAELRAQLEADEAFWVAAHRLGTPDALTREFGKIQPNTGWLLRAQWLLLGLLAYWLLVPIVGVMVHGLVVLLASVPELRSAAAAIRLMSSSIALLLTAGLVVLTVRSWRGSPERFERHLYNHGLPGHWLLILASALTFGIRYGSFHLTGLLTEHSRDLLYAPGMIAPLQSSAWPMIASAMTFLLPALASVAVVRIQVRRRRRSATSFP